MSSCVLYTKYIIFPYLEHKLPINNVPFIQTFTHKYLISGVKCHENAAGKLQKKLVPVWKLKTLLLKVKVRERVMDLYLKLTELVENCYVNISKVIFVVFSFFSVFFCSI